MGVQVNRVIFMLYVFVLFTGESGMGKSTLLSNLFCKFDLYNDRQELGNHLLIE